jgi:hypothetical protein
MSALCLLHSWVLCLVVGSGGSAAVQTEAAPPLSSPFTVLWRPGEGRTDGWSRDACFRLSVARLLEYAACGPAPAAGRGDCHDSAPLRVSLPAGAPPSSDVATPCAPDCLYLAWGQPASLAWATDGCLFVRLAGGEAART